MKRYLNEKHSGVDEWHRREVGVYHASAMGKCVRRHYFNFKEDTQPENDAYPHFELGNRLEDLYEDALKEEYGEKYVKNDVPIKFQGDDYKIVGSTDPVIINDNGDIETIFEVKTTGNLKYTRGSPKDRHLYQLMCYMKALNVNKANIVYINKYNLETVTHEVQFDIVIWNDILNRAERLHEALENDEPPEPVNSDESDYFCEFDERCCENE